MTDDAYLMATRFTAGNLKTIAATPKISELSRLTLPEIDELTNQIAQIVPAGNVPGLILNGLVRLEGRFVPAREQQRHLVMLFRGMQGLLDKAVYGAMFAGPAAVIIGYQKLLQLAGKDIDAAFPNGTWQFYLEFALREDSARHTNETTGYQAALNAHGITLRDADSLAAWIMAVSNTLSQYDHLLENEWRERVYSALLRQVAQLPALENAYATWESRRPFQRGSDAGSEYYAAYRHRKFDEFIASLLEPLPSSASDEFWNLVAQAERDSLPAYLRQMSIFAYLDPGSYQETRTTYPSRDQTLIGIIYRGNYHFIPAIFGGMSDKVNPHEQAAAILAATPASPSNLDLLLTEAERIAQADLRGKLDPSGQTMIQFLRRCPILINWDRQDVHSPLALIRRDRRGIGDHALTLFFTPESTVFDQSHIFFDGAWGAALAEIMTNEALSWAQYFVTLPSPNPKSPARGMTFSASPDLRRSADSARLNAEASAENTDTRLGPILTLRRLFKTRSDLVNVTVNDLLVLYRAIFGALYEPSATLNAELEALHADPRSITQAAYTATMEAVARFKASNPAILIPMDASQFGPRERLFPTTFRNPMSDLLSQHQATLQALHAYREASGNRAELYAVFDESQRLYLRMIAAFGMLMRRYKEVALSGGSISTTSIKLLAHMPDPVKRLLDQVPGRFDVLNEIIKGEEVFSNVGRVAKGSTLRRFITAKDDNRGKTLAWGILTDDQDVVHLSLRDFRPHVTVLYDGGMAHLANRITKDTLDAYADGFNRFVRELRDITVASRETRSEPLSKDNDR